MRLNALILAAGYGNRLKPLTDFWPKCLMPINEKPLLQIWLDQLSNLNLETILVNTHYFHEEVEAFLNQPKYRNKIIHSFERDLLGSAGTVRDNNNLFKGSPLLIIHGDNFTGADLNEFIYAHKNRPKNCVMTMMTFETDCPSSCGIVEVKDKVVTSFHEKVNNPPSNMANAAVYIVEKEILEFIEKNTLITDFSNEVIPKFLGKIHTWHNENYHIDIGTPENFFLAQTIDLETTKAEKTEDQWEYNFRKHVIHNEIEKLNIELSANNL